MDQEQINELIDDSVPNWRWLQIQRERERKAEELQCPVCGYYCLGNGGVGCIDKPSLVSMAQYSHNFNRPESAP